MRTSTTITSNLNPSIYGQAVTLMANVTSAGWIAPTGKVVFRNSGMLVGSATINAGVASLTKTNLPAGTLSITATYTGDVQSITSTSAPVSQAVTPASTNTSITSSANPSNTGQSVAFTAQVTSPTASVAGKVMFLAGTTNLGTVELHRGMAVVMTTSLPKGRTKITALYNGTSNINGSTASLTQVVKHHRPESEQTH